jgi:hypothetical protein
MQRNLRLHLQGSTGNLRLGCRKSTAAQLNDLFCVLRLEHGRVLLLFGWLRRIRGFAHCSFVTGKMLQLRNPCYRSAAQQKKKKTVNLRLGNSCSLHQQFNKKVSRIEMLYV